MAKAKARLVKPATVAVLLLEVLLVVVVSHLVMLIPLLHF